MDRNAQFSSLIYSGLTLISWTRIGSNFPGDFMSFNESHNFSHRDSEVSRPYCFKTRYAIFLRWIFLIFKVSFKIMDRTNSLSILFLVKRISTKKRLSMWENYWPVSDTVSPHLQGHQQTTDQLVTSASLLSVNHCKSTSPRSPTNNWPVGDLSQPAISEPL